MKQYPVRPTFPYIFEMHRQEDEASHLENPFAQTEKRLNAVLQVLIGMSSLRAV